VKEVHAMIFRSSREREQREREREMDSQVPKLSLALGLGPPVLLLLQLLGHLQIVLSQATLVDVGRQVALDCGHKHTPHHLKAHPG